MTEFSPADLHDLLAIADGADQDAKAESFEQMAANGLIQHISSEDVDVAQQYRSLNERAEALRDQAREVLHPGGLRSLAVRILPGPRRTATEKARKLRTEAKDIDGRARKYWLQLSEKNLLDMDLKMCADCADGGKVQITDQGRRLLQSWLYSEQFEESLESEGVSNRARRFRAVRRKLLEEGFEPDPRVDLAAAILSRTDSDTDRLRELNRRATQTGWRSYDRLPILAAMRPLGEEPDQIWRQFEVAYDALKDRDWQSGYETRLAAVHLARGGAIDRGCERLWGVTRRLRAYGWSMAESTVPPAARLVRLSLSEAKIAGRVQRLEGDLSRPQAPSGPFLALAASVGADSNLHPLAVKKESAQLLQRETAFAPLVERYDAALGAFEGRGEGQCEAVSAAADSIETALWPIVAILLALAPGAIDRNLHRLNAAVDAVRGGLRPRNALPLAAILIDSSYPDWFDTSRFAFEVGSALSIAEQTSMFNAFRRMSKALEAPTEEPGKIGDGLKS